MGLITLQTPILGDANASEDPKIASDLTILQTLLNGNIDVTNLSAALQALIPTGTGTGVWTTYSPTWTCSPTPPTIGNGVLSGAYMTFGKTCVVRINLQVGSTTNGGIGSLTFSLPVASAPVEQEVACKLGMSIDGTNWLGFGFIGPSSTTVAPFFPKTAGNCSMAPFANETAVAMPGIPASGGLPIYNGSTFVCSGLYQTT